MPSSSWFKFCHSSKDAQHRTRACFTKTKTMSSGVQATVMKKILNHIHLAIQLAIAPGTLFGQKGIQPKSTPGYQFPCLCGRLHCCRWHETHAHLSLNEKGAQRQNKCQIHPEDSFLTTNKVRPHTIRAPGSHRNPPATNYYWLPIHHSAMPSTCLPIETSVSEPWSSPVASRACLCWICHPLPSAPVHAQTACLCPHPHQFIC